MELTADLLKSLNNIRQNATIYVHAYHYTDDEKCVMAPRSSLPSLELTVLQSEKIIDLLLSGSGYIRHGDMEKKLWQLSQYRRVSTIISGQIWH
ncbi:hypothetical protein ACMFC3_19795 [Escherichia coli]